MVLAGLYLRQVVVLVEAFLAPKRHLRLLLRARSVRLHCGSRLQLQRLRHLGGRSCCLSTLCGRDDYLHAAVELEADRVCVHRRRYQPLSCAAIHSEPQIRVKQTHIAFSTGVIHGSCSGRLFICPRLNSPPADGGSRRARAGRTSRTHATQKGSH
eukprot:scaffold19190_cov53-Phaeocystis_antarctica.AAC.3